MHTDREALQRARAAIESDRRHAAGDAPFTLCEAADALGVDPPVSQDDLIVLAAVCERWHVRTTLDNMPAFQPYRELARR